MLNLDRVYLIQIEYSMLISDRVNMLSPDGVYSMLSSAEEQLKAIKKH